METNFTKHLKNFFIVLVLTLQGILSYGQTNTYNMYLNNINYTSCTTLEFDIWLEWTGTNSQKLQYFQAGINFNYNGLANGGAMTGEFVQGSADASLPTNQQMPNWNINSTSQQIRMYAQIASPSSVALAIPGPPGIRMGTFRITNTADFAAPVTPDFSWSFSSGSSSTTETKLGFYLGGATTSTNIADPNSQLVTANPATSPNCTAGIPELTASGISDFSVSPNPSNGRINLVFNSNSNSKMTIEIFDYTGKNIRTEFMEAFAGNNSKEIITGDFSNGIYLLNLKKEGAVLFTQRLLIE